jgi:hypothetical protein
LGWQGCTISTLISGKEAEATCDASSEFSERLSRRPVNDHVITLPGVIPEMEVKIIV